MSVLVALRRLQDVFSGADGSKTLSSLSDVDATVITALLRFLYSAHFDPALDEGRKSALSDLAVRLRLLYHEAVVLPSSSVRKRHLL